MTKRRNFTRDTRVEIAKRARRPDGQLACERCGAVGCRLEIHHKVMDAMEVDKSRKLTADDGEMICEPCHDPITSAQRKVLAKALEREAKHVGATRPKGALPKPPSENDRRKREPIQVANGPTGLARRYGVSK